MDFKPELLVSEIAMANEDGYSLLGRIRALGPERGGDVSALALTSLVGDEHRRRALESGFQAHIAKPVDIEQLVTARWALLKRPRHASGADDGAARP